MKNTMMMLVAVVAIASMSVAVADDVYWADRDNGIWSKAGDYNFGANTSVGNYRFCKGDGDGTWMGDWSQADLAAIKATLEAGPATVRLEFTARGTVIPDPISVKVGAFQSSTDWVEGTGNPYATQAGSCYNYRDSSPAGNQYWTDTTGMIVPNFWLVPEVSNSTNITSCVSGVYSVVLDQSVVDALINPTGRGLRVSSDVHYGNEEIFYVEAGQPFAPRLVVTPVPEPATMMLLGIGGLATLIRRKRQAA